MNNLAPDGKRLGQGKARLSLPMLKRILGYAGKHQRYVTAAMIFAAIGCTFDVIAPYYMGRAIDRMVGKNQVDFPGIATILVALLCFYLLSALLSFLMNYFAGIVAARTAASLREDGFARVNQMPISFFDGTSHGDMLSRFVNDIDAIADGLLQGMVQLISGTVTIVGTLIFMFVMSWKMTLIVLPTAGLTFILASAIVRRTGKYFRSQQKSIGELDGLVEEMFSGQREMKAFGRENEAQKEFDALNEELQVVGQKAQFASSLPNPSTRFVNNIAYILIGVFGYIAGGLSVGRISSFITYWNAFSRPLNDITNITSQIMAAFASAERVFSVIDMPVEEPDREDAITPDKNRVKGEVSFRNVAFSYLPTRPLIQDFSLLAPPGSRIAVVGPTGAGKTTLMNLLMRFYDPQEGSILIDGVDTRSMTRDGLRSLFGLVLQETWLFSGTIHDNLAYGKPDATREEVIAAAKAVRAHSFIRRLPDGYDTVISEDGGSLSQGQKQLLTIARAMVASPPMLILDEATSSVDTLTELEIQNAFLVLMKNRTSFVIAHRLSTIREADCILVMKDGKNIEQGTHEELLAAHGFYEKLYTSQFAGRGLETDPTS